MVKVDIERPAVCFASAHECELWERMVCSVTPVILEMYSGRIPTVATAAAFADEAVLQARRRKDSEAV
jgi:hypothetical protein